jgi:membrane fusion protein, multidrug efflux system
MTDLKSSPEEAQASGMNSVPGSPQPDLSAPRAKRGRVRAVLLAVAVVALIAIAIWFVHHQTTGKYMQATSDAYVQADAVTVSPKVSGYVDRVFVADN